MTPKEIQELAKYFVANAECAAQLEIKDPVLREALVNTFIQAITAIRGPEIKTTLKFPTMLRKMWSGGEVQKWLDSQRIVSVTELDDILSKWEKPSHIKLHAGECSAQEIRTVTAVVGAIRRALCE